jgi:hypothetical protein
VALARRSRIRERNEIAGRASALRALVLVAAGKPPPDDDPPFSPRELQLLSRPPEAWEEQDVTDALWRGEALGTLAWALQLVVDLPAYDTPFDHVGFAGRLAPEASGLREAAELEHARETARLWHWRARTTLLQRGTSVELPARWTSFDQLIATVAMRGHEEGYLPVPLRGDFRAFGKIYRQLDEAEHALAHSIAAERHYALEWLFGDAAWDEVETDT